VGAASAKSRSVEARRMSDTRYPAKEFETRVR
jgi:hypothetical protein